MKSFKKSISKMVRLGTMLLLVFSILLSSVIMNPQVVLAIPLSPTGPTVVLTAQTRNIVLTWNDPALGVETGFYVYRDTVNTFNSVNLMKLVVGPSAAPAWTGTYTDIAPVSGATYFYKVTSYDGTGESAPTPTVTITVPSATPTTVTAVRTAGTRNIVVSWRSTAYGTELGNYILRDTVNTFNSPNLKMYKVLGAVPAPVAPATVWQGTYTDIAGALGGTYYYKVVAYDLTTVSLASAASAVLNMPAAPPTTLTAAIPAGTQNVVLNWVSTSARQELGFYIFADTVTTFNSVNLNQFSVGNGVTTYTDTPASAGTWYYRVTAYDLTGQTAPSNTVTAVVPTGAPVPAAPTNLILTVGDTAGTQANLAWTDNAINETNFVVQRASDAAMTTSLFTATLGANVLGYSDVGLTAGTTYYYRVYSRNGAGNSWMPATGTPITMAAPIAPSSFTAAALSATSVNLTWVDNSNNEGSFRLDRASDTGFTTNLVQTTIPLGTTNYIDTTTAGATTYSYRVVAVNLIGNSAVSNTVTLTTPVALTWPSQLTGLTATPISSSQINLAWIDTATNEDRYGLDRDTVPTFNSLNHIAVSLPINTNSYQDTGLSPNTLYYYSIYCSNAAGNSFGSRISVTTLGPQAPVGLTAALVNSTTVNLAWTDNATDETGYRVERSIDNFTSVNATFTLPADSTSYSDTTIVSGGTTYYYRVYATSALGSSIASNVVSVATPTIGPNAPYNLTATLITQGQINLSWTSNSTNHVGFYIYSATTANFTTDMVVIPVGPAVTSYSDTTVYAGDTFYYKVTSYNVLGESGPSNVVSVNIPLIAGVPDAPTGLAYTIDASNNVTLSWTETSINVNTFFIERALDTLFTNVEATFSVGGASTNFTDTTALPLKTYYYRVTAVNAWGNSIQSNWIMVITGDQVVATPSSLIGTVTGPTSISLSWIDNAINESNYNVQRATNPQFTGSVTFTIPQNSTSYVDNSVVAGTTYYYQVYASKPGYNSVATNAIMIQAGIPVAPSGLAGISSEPTVINLTWVDNSNNENNFRLERAPTNTFATITSTVLPSNSNNYVDETVMANTTYYYRVYATNAAGDSVVSNTAMVTSTLNPPASPTGLTATATRSTRISLTWVNQDATTTSFTLQRASDIAFTTGLVNTNIPTTPLAVGAIVTRNDTNVASTTYFYRVYANNNGGSSSASNVVSATTPAATPGAIPARPPVPTAVLFSPNQINLSWVDNANNEEGFRIYTAIDPGFLTGTSVFTVPASAGTGLQVAFSDTTVYPGDTFYYQTSAFNALGESARTATVSVVNTLTPPGAPLPPSGVLATPVGASEIDISWVRNSTNELGFLIDRAQDAAFTVNLVTFGAPANSTLYADTTAQPGVTYYYRVAAYNAIGVSIDSNPVVATITTSAPPVGPTGLMMTSVAADQVSMAWTNNANNAAGIRLQRALDLNFTVGLTTINLGATISLYTDISVASNTTYYYRVFAYNALGDSLPSNPLIAYTPVAGVPAGISGLTATIMSATSINLRWIDAGVNTSGWRVDRATNPSFTGLVTVQLPIGTTSYTDTVTANTLYYYRVFGTNSAGLSPPSNVTVDMRTPAAPRSLTTVVANQNTINLSWVRDSANEDGFQIDRAMDIDFSVGVKLFFAPAGYSNYSDTTANPGYTYYYRVTAFSYLLGSATSATVTTASTVPLSPINLTGAASGANQVNLAWTDRAVNETGYRVERSTDNFATVSGNFALAANSVSFIDTNVLAATTYQYRVFAVNTIGDSLPSNVVTVTTKSPFPAAPYGLNATAPSSTQVNLTWTDNSTIETGYRVERSIDNFTTINATALLAPNSNMYTDTSVVANTTYYYRVKAFNAAGDSAASNVASVSTAPVPIALTGLTATVASAGQINLAWTDPNAPGIETSQALQRSTDINFATNVTTYILAAYSTRFVDAGLSAGTTYYYRVYGVNANGSSPSSNVANGTTWAASPAQPTGLTASASGGTQVNLRWTDNALNENGYRLERSTDNFTTISAAFNLVANSVMFIDTGLTSATTYYYRVFAYNAAGNSPSSNVVSVVTIASPPSSPTGLNATLSGNRVNLTWTMSNSNESGYWVERAEDINFTIGYNSFIPLGVTGSFSDTTIVTGAGKRYYYRVSAFNSSGYSAPSTPANVLVP